MRFLLVSLTVLSAGTAARIAAADEFLQPSSVRPTALAYDNYYAQDVPDSPGHLAVATDLSAYGNTVASSPDGGCTSVADGCCGSCGDSCCNGCGRRSWLPGGNPCFGELLPCCNCGDPWKLLDPCCDRYSFGGWINGGVLTNDEGFPNNGVVPFLSTDDFLMNQLWAYAERSADNGGYGWAWGARIDYVFGADGPDTQAFGDNGWDFGWNSGGNNILNQTYGSAIPQLYMEVAYNDLKVKLGRFYTIQGYEVVQAPGNFFYTHAYTMNYGEPFTHTGALGEYAYDEDTTVWGGYVFGWDTGWENLIDSHMFIGGVSLARWEDATITYTVSAGDFGFANGASLGDAFLQSLVVEYELNDNWTYVFQSDLGIVGGIPNTREQDWYGINQYLFYTINSCWTAGARFEWFNDEEGSRVNGFASRGDYFNVALGVNYKPNANVIVRPEIRGDWFDATDAANATRPFAGGTKDEQLMAGFDVIFLF